MYFYQNHIEEADMARNITISVPDELHEDIQQAKGNIKVSSICQDALRKAVKIAQAIESEDILALREKFQSESKAMHQPYWDEGFKDGQKDAFCFDYVKAVDFLICRREGEGDRETLYMDFEYKSSEESREKYNNILDGKDTIHGSKDYRRASICEVAADVYSEGWTDGALAVVKKALE